MRAAGASTPRKMLRIGGTVSVDCPHAFEVCRELLAREILVDYRPQAGIRLSPHFYNQEQECDFALSQIEEILNTRAWEKQVLAREAGLKR
jgi:kynureninase